MHISLRVVSNDCLIVVACAIRLHINAQGPINFQLESVINQQLAQVRQIGRYSHGRIVNLPTSSRHIISFYTLNIQLMKTALEAFQLLL